MSEPELAMYRVTHELPAHLHDWQLPPGWNWGTEGLYTQDRHYQEVVDALDRSLSLVSATDPAHHKWLEAEARYLAHRNHPAMPTTYHYWASFSEVAAVPAICVAGSQAKRLPRGFGAWARKTFPPCFASCARSGRR